MEKLENLILVLASAISKWVWVGIYDFLGIENKYSIYPTSKKYHYMCSNQKELKEFDITKKDILQLLLKFINAWYKTKENFLREKD